MTSPSKPFSTPLERRAAREHDRDRQALFADPSFDPRSGAGATPWRVGGSWSGWLDQGQRGPVARSQSERLVEDLRFCRTLIGLIAPGKARAVNWAQADTGWGGHKNAVSMSQGTVILDPAPIVAGNLAPGHARDISAGNAIHEAAHLAYSDPEAHRAVDRAIAATHGEFATDDQPVIYGLWNMLEDRRIEATTLGVLPGYEGYLAACWDYDLPPEVIEDRIAEAARDWNGGSAINAMLALAATYQPITGRQRGLLRGLPPERRRVIARGLRLFRTAGQPGRTAADMPALALRLARLMRDGAPNPDDPDLTGAPGLLGVEAVALVTIDSAGITRQEASTTRPTAALTQPQAREVERLEREEWRPDQAPLPPPVMPRQSPLLDMARGGPAPLVPGHRTHGSRVGAASRQLPTSWLTPALTDTAGAVYLRDLAVVREAAEHLATALQLRTEDRVGWRGGYTSGYLDEATLGDLPLYRHDAAPAPLFRRRYSVAAPRVGIGLLVDESASMTAANKYLHARRAAILVDAALRTLRGSGGGDGVSWLVRGHSGDEGGTSAASLTLRRYVDDDRDDPRRLGLLSARGSTYDGPAFALVLREVERRWQDRTRLVIVISDGMPQGRGYGGQPALAQQREQVARARASGTGVIALFIGTPSDAEAAGLRAMYGPGVLTVPNPAGLVSTLGATVARELAWEG